MISVQKSAKQRKYFKRARETFVRHPDLPSFADDFGDILRFFDFGRNQGFELEKRNLGTSIYISVNLNLPMIS